MKDFIVFVYLSAYEIWGSPEMLKKEKLKRAKTRQDEYEALFSLKKSVKEYQKRLLLLENASFDNRKSVNSFHHFKNKDNFHS